MPKWPLPPSCAYDTEMYAFWDLLHRPNGCSVRKLEAAFREKHGSPSEMWLFWLTQHPFFVFFHAPVGERGEPKHPMYGRARSASTLRVRRTWPRASEAPSSDGFPSQRLQLACAAFEQWSVNRSEDEARERLVHAGAADVPTVACRRPDVDPTSLSLIGCSTGGRMLRRFTPRFRRATCRRLRWTTCSRHLISPTSKLRMLVRFSLTTQQQLLLPSFVGGGGYSRSAAQATSGLQLKRAPSL